MRKTVRWFVLMAGLSAAVPLMAEDTMTPGGTSAPTPTSPAVSTKESPKVPLSSGSPHRVHKKKKSMKKGEIRGGGSGLNNMK